MRAALRVILGLHLAALLAYVAAWLLHLSVFRRARPPSSRLPLAVLMTGVALHAAALATFAVVARALPLIGVGPASSTLALAVVLLLLAFSLRADTRATGLVLLPLVLVLLVEAVVVGFHRPARDLAFRGPWFVLHVSAVFVGLAGLVLASAAAAMYVLQFRALKRKEFGPVFGFFPSLDALDRMNRVGLGIGYPALTLGLLAGWGWTLTYGRGWALDNPEVVLGIVAWLAYLFAIAARLIPRWRGRFAAWVSTGAFLATALAFVLLRVFTSRPPGTFL